ncbi:HEPN domain-containing protein [Mycolicibacterium thermoresistibile]
MTDRFPEQTPETIGQFQVVFKAAAAETTATPPRTGVLRFRDSRVELEVSPSFNPIVEWTQRGPGSFAGSPPQQRVTDDAVVLGATAINPGEVSLWGLRSLRRHLLGFPSPGEDEPRSREVLRADWCLVGALFPDDETEFDTVTLDFTGLHEFANLPSVRTELPDTGMTPMRWVYDPPGAAEGVLSIPAPGKVRFEPLASIPTLGGPDIVLTTGTRLKLAFDNALPLPTVVSTVAVPIATALTILNGAECRVRQLNLSVPSGDSADVYGHVVDASAPRDAVEDPLFTLDDAGGADFVGRWLELSQRVSPVPQILAASYAGEFRTVETEALSLCTAAENLHRRMYPDVRRWTAETVDAAAAGLQDADIPEEVRQALTQAVGQYLYEPSFPRRIEALAGRAAEAVPECVGRINRWKRAVTDQRNTLAHGLRQEEENPDLTEMHYITRSLRWVLTVCLLLEAGVPSERLAGAVRANSRFERDARNWRSVWPNVFAQE